MSGPLEGRVALVAGGSGPIGRAVCAVLAEAGARVLVHSRRGTPTEADAHESAYVRVQADLTDDAGLARLAAAVERAGGADVLVNAVHPAAELGAVADATRAGLEVHLDAVRIHAALLGMVVPGMRERGWGRIVYVSGATTNRPLPGRGVYGAAKAAASVLTRYVAFEEGRAGITANVVAPGRVVDPDVPDELPPDLRTVSDDMLARGALGVFPSPADVAAAVHALVALGSTGVTGQTVWVTGGEAVG